MPDYMTKTIVDSDTGEIKYDKTVKITELYNDSGYLFWSSKLSTRDFRDIYYPIQEYDYIGVFHLLTKHFLYNDNMLQIKRNNNYSPLTLSDIASFLSVSDRQVRRYIKRFIDSGMIRIFNVSNGCKYYVVNPIYSMFGKRLSVVLYCMFKDILVDFLPQNVKKEFDTRIKNGE